MELHRQRQYHASGPQPLSHSDIYHFITCNLSIPQNVVSKFKKLVYSLDEVYQSHYYESKT